MVGPFHGILAAASIHVIANWIYANAAARTGAGGFVSGDVGKVALQSDDNTLWLLTATTPTWVRISNDPTSVARANHTGTQLAATISDFDTQVRTSRLDQMTAPTADLSINSHKLTNVTDPTSAQDAATKIYVDSFAQGLSWKQAVRAATAVAGTLATSFENGDVIDGVTLATGDRILLKNQAAGEENGIYIVAASGAPTRSLDANTAAEILQASMFVQEGTANADTLWVNSTNAPITLETTPLVFAQLSGGGSTYSEGSGIDITATVVSLDIPSLTNDASPTTADYLLTYDVSAAAHKKVLISALPPPSASLTVEETDASPTDSAVTKIKVSPDSLSISSHEATVITGQYNNVHIVLGNATDVISTGLQKFALVCPFDGYIEGWDIYSTGGVTGSIVLDIWKDTYANYPPTVADTITASAKPTVSSAAKAQDSTLTSWIRTFSRGDILHVNVDSVTTFTIITFVLRTRRTA